jgi:hypothetical protein
VAARSLADYDEASIPAARRIEVGRLALVAV